MLCVHINKYQQHEKEEEGEEEEKPVLESLEKNTLMMAPRA